MKWYLELWAREPIQDEQNILKEEDAINATKFEVLFVLALHGTLAMLKISFHLNLINAIGFEVLFPLALHRTLAILKINFDI